MYKKYLKRLFDFCFSLIALIVLLPVLLILLFVGAIAMKGNPIFLQKRPGIIDKRRGQEKIISLLKFRTMSNEKDENGVLLPDEKRLNAYGRFLRSTSADELPSLLNIIKGDLSIVGPRPLSMRYLPFYNSCERKRHTVMPGLTGLAQVNGRNATTWPERFSYDIEYVENMSFFFDLKILVKTILVVLKRSNIGTRGVDAPEDFDVYRKRQSKESEQ